MGVAGAKAVSSFKPSGAKLAVLAPLVCWFGCTARPTNADLSASTSAEAHHAWLTPAGFVARAQGLAPDQLQRTYDCREGVFAVYALVRKPGCTTDAEELRISEPITWENVLEDAASGSMVEAWSGRIKQLQGPDELLTSGWVSFAAWAKEPFNRPSEGPILQFSNANHCDQLGRADFGRNVSLGRTVPAGEQFVGAADETGRSITAILRAQGLASSLVRTGPNFPGPVTAGTCLPDAPLVMSSWYYVKDCIDRISYHGAVVSGQPEREKFRVERRPDGKFVWANDFDVGLGHTLEGDGDGLPNRHKKTNWSRQSVSSAKTRKGGRILGAPFMALPWTENSTLHKTRGRPFFLT